MKYSLSLLFIFSFYFNSICQTRAVTTEGDTIYVYNNGTWSYEKLEQNPEYNELAYLASEIKIDTLKEKFICSSNTTKEVKNSQGQFKIKYDDKLWKRVPAASLNEDAEFAFQNKKSDIWCVVISEETPIDSETLYKIAKKSLEDNTGSEVKILKTELRNVNGIPVIRGVLKATFTGITFVFDSYYFSNEKGSVQFTTWTSEKVWKRTEKDILELLNGFVVD